MSELICKPYALIGALLLTTPLWAQEAPLPAPVIETAPAPVVVTTSGGTTSAERGAAASAQSEVVRRNETVFLANGAISDGYRLLDAGDYSRAFEKLDFARRTLEPLDTKSASYRRAIVGVAAAKSGMAKEIAKSGDRLKAIALVEEAIELDPKNPNYPRQLEELKREQAIWEAKRFNPEALENNVAVNDAFVEKVAAVQKLIFEGDRYFETGAYDMSERSYLKVLALDPYNKAARQKLDRLERFKMRTAEVARGQSRAEAMMNVASKWSEVVRPDDFAKRNDAPDPGNISNIAKITRKLETIIIPTLSFNDVSVEDVVQQFLIPKSRELDPEKEGVNFVLKLEPSKLPTVEARPGATPAADATPPPVPIMRTVNLNLTNVPLIDVLKFLTNLTNLKFKIDEYAVYLLPATESSEVFITRTFLVPAGFVPASMDSGASTPGTRLTGASVTIDMKKVLMDQGVEFPVGATAAFLRGSSKLVVKNTPEQIDVIELLIKAREKETPQIEIEAKLAEFTEESLKEISFQYVLGESGAQPTLIPIQVAGIPTTPYSAATALRNGRSTGVDPNFGGLSQNSVDGLLRANNGGGNITPVNPITGTALLPGTPNTFVYGGLIEGRGFAMLMNLLDQKKGVDLLTAPRVTTKPKSPAKIEIIREFRYPTEFEKPRLDFFTTSTGSNIAIPPTPSDFKEESVGVTLEVTPTLAGSRRIDLIIKPTVTDFEGFINYGSPITQLETQPGPGFRVPTGNVNILANGVINQPVFNRRAMETTIQVNDGQTVMMGGLIREDRQKVDDKVPILGDIPLLGRLFRSKVDQTTKRNLMIFVTARLISPTGKPQFAQETMPPVATISK